MNPDFSLRELFLSLFHPSSLKEQPKDLSWDTPSEYSYYAVTFHHRDRI